MYDRSVKYEKNLAFSCQRSASLIDVKWHARPVRVKVDLVIDEADDKKRGAIDSESQADDCKCERRKDWGSYKRNGGVERCWDGESRVDSAGLRRGCLRHGS